MIYILEGTFELVFPGEPPTRLRTGEGATFHSVGRYRITNVGEDKAAFSESACIPKPTRTGGGGPPAPSLAHVAEIA